MNQPPIDNAFVAHGCEQFQSAPPMSAARDAIREALADQPEPPAASPLCYVGNSTYLRHDLRPDGVCARCGWALPGHKA